MGSDIQTNCRCVPSVLQKLFGLFCTGLSINYSMAFGLMEYRRGYYNPAGEKRLLLFLLTVLGYALIELFLHPFLENLKITLLEIGEVIRPFFLEISRFGKNYLG